VSEGSSLPVLQAAGFGASVDAVAWELQSEADTHHLCLWFLSLLGPQQSVKALWARLVKGEVASLSFEDLGSACFCALAPEGPRSWRFFGASLPAAAGYHGVLVPEKALYGAESSDFLLLPREGAALLHYRFLNRRLDLPLHPSWADWLWQRALDAGEAIPLEAQGIEAYRCAPNSDALAVDLSAAIRARTLGLGHAAA
jgi:hypothetical protein